MTNGTTAKTSGPGGARLHSGISHTFIEWMKEHGEGELWERFEETQKRYRAQRPTSSDKQNYHGKTSEQLDKLERDYSDRIRRIRLARERLKVPSPDWRVDGVASAEVPG